MEGRGLARTAATQRMLKALNATEAKKLPYGHLRRLAALTPIGFRVAVGNWERQRLVVIDYGMDGGETQIELTFAGLQAASAETGL